MERCDIWENRRMRIGYRRVGNEALVEWLSNWQRRQWQAAGRLRPRRDRGNRAMSILQIIGREAGAALLDNLDRRLARMERRDDIAAAER